MDVTLLLIFVGGFLVGSLVCLGLAAVLSHPDRGREMDQRDYIDW